MKFTTVERDTVTVIELQGNLMGGPDASSLNGKLHDLISQGKKRIIIDMGGVEFMNSSGLGLLIGGVTTMKTAGGGLKLAHVSEKIRELIRITKLTTLFEMYPTVDEAFASFTK